MAPHLDAIDQAAIGVAIAHDVMTPAPEYKCVPRALVVYASSLSSQVKKEIKQCYVCRDDVYHLKPNENPNALKQALSKTVWKVPDPVSESELVNCIAAAIDLSEAVFRESPSILAKRIGPDLSVALIASLVGVDVVPKWGRTTRFDLSTWGDCLGVDAVVPVLQPGKTRFQQIRFKVFESTIPAEPYRDKFPQVMPDFKHPSYTPALSMIRDTNGSLELDDGSRVAAMAEFEVFLLCNDVGSDHFLPSSGMTEELVRLVEWYRDRR